MSFRLALLRMLESWCFSAQVGQRVWPSTAGFEQFTQRPLALCSARQLAA